MVSCDHVLEEFVRGIARKLVQHNQQPTPQPNIVTHGRGGTFGGSNTRMTRLW